jgi:1,4-alpha-glucan branching enzyme
MAGTNGKKRVAFAYEAPEAESVTLCGTFNDWDPSATPMKKDKKGVWKSLLSLTPGAYEYRLVVDGVWANDPSAEGFVPNEFGEANCLRLVTT